MNDNPVGLRVALVLNIALFSCCANHAERKLLPSVSQSQKQEKTLDQSIAELNRLYEAAKSEHDRRAVCLRAIDEGLIHQGAPVSVIDEIFGTHFASELPKGNEVIRKDLILFASQPVPPTRSDGRPAGVDYVGWYMAFGYDQKGVVQNYYLTNLHKGNGSPRVEGKVAIPELRRLYETAQTEFDRRTICLRAIDEGALITYQSVSPVDEIFGTHFATELPSKKESIRKANIEFAASKPDGHSGWFLAIEYDFQGTLLSYYLTNVHKQ